jgi:hypothetical protein
VWAGALLTILGNKSVTYEASSTVPPSKHAQTVSSTSQTTDISDMNLRQINANLPHTNAHNSAQYGHKVGA